LSRVVRMLVVTAVCALGLGALTGSAAAGIWTEVPSATSGTITAIEYQSDTRFWFTTANGAIYKRNADLSGFHVVRAASAIPLNDIEFQAGGAIGLAVGDGGQVLRSINSGDTWTVVPAAGIPVSNLGDGSANQCTFNVPLGDVNFVHFAGSGRVWIGGAERRLATSQPGVANNVGLAGTWVDANRKSPPVAGDNCRVEQTGGFTDMFVTGNPDVFYLASAGFSGIAFSTDNLASETQTKPEGAANGFEIGGRIAGDLDNPNRLWGVSGAPYGNSTAQYTEDGYQTAEWFRVLNEDAHPFPSTGPADVDFAGGTVLAAGNAGYVLHSVNGRDFYWNGGDGALATQDWRSVALASATQGAVGGIDGKLMLTTQASSIPGAGGTPPGSGPGPGPGPGPGSTTPTKTAGFDFTGKGNSLTATIVGRKVRVRMRGAVKPPKGVSVKTACTGKIKLTLKKKTRKLATRTVKLKLKKGKCRFAKTVLVPRKKVGKATSLRLTVRFQGNRVLKAGQKRYTLLITR
jgi:hypothetical protein